MHPSPTLSVTSLAEGPAKIGDAREVRMTLREAAEPLTALPLSRYDSEKKLARRRSTRPGPWPHLREQVMRMDCTTRRPAPDRWRVCFVSSQEYE